jgi:hypothetical protein
MHYGDIRNTLIRKYTQHTYPILPYSVPLATGARAGAVGGERARVRYGILNVWDAGDVSVEFGAHTAAGIRHARCSCIHRRPRLCEEDDRCRYGNAATSCKRQSMRRTHTQTRTHTNPKPAPVRAFTFCVLSVDAVVGSVYSCQTTICMLFYTQHLIYELILTTHPLICVLILNACVAGGVSALYQGLIPNLLKVLPATSISYAVYDRLSKPT